MRAERAFEEGIDNHHQALDEEEANFLRRKISQVFNDRVRLMRPDRFRSPQFPPIWIAAVTNEGIVLYWAGPARLTTS